MIPGGDQARGAGRGRRAEGDLDLARLGGVRAVQHPDVAGHVVDDPLAVRRGVPGVPAVVIGVPPDPSPVQGAGVDVAGALVVGQEEQPVADQHRAGQLTRQVRQDPGERPLAGGDPHLAGGTAPVALPVRRVAEPAGEQRGSRLPQGQVEDRPERQPARGALERDRVGPGVLPLGLADGADREDLRGGGPAGHRHPVVAPVREPGRVAAVRVGRVHLRIPVPPARPRDARPVGREPRGTYRGGVGRQPPRAAPFGRGEPDVILCDEDE